MFDSVRPVRSRIGSSTHKFNVSNFDGIVATHATPMQMIEISDFILSVDVNDQERVSDNYKRIYAFAKNLENNARIALARVNNKIATIEGNFGSDMNSDVGYIDDGSDDVR